MGRPRGRGEATSRRSRTTTIRRPSSTIKHGVHVHAREFASTNTTDSDRPIPRSSPPISAPWCERVYARLYVHHRPVSSNESVPSPRRSYGTGCSSSHSPPTRYYTPTHAHQTHYECDVSSFNSECRNEFQTNGVATESEIHRRRRRRRIDRRMDFSDRAYG